MTPGVAGQLAVVVIVTLTIEYFVLKALVRRKLRKLLPHIEME